MIIAVVKYKNIKKKYTTIILAFNDNYIIRGINNKALSFYNI